MEDGTKGKIRLTCPLCGSFETAGGGTAGAYKIFECENCFGSFCDPMKEGGAEFYEGSYGATGGGYGEEKEEFTNFFEKIKKVQSKGTILEVGCGPGYLLKTAKDFGFEVFGVDPNRHAVGYARGLGLENVHVGGIKDISSIFGSQKFDSIVLFSVLEHLDNPLSSLQMLGAHLHPGGTIFIVVPNKDRSSVKYILKHRRDGWDYPPHHLTRWSQETLLKILKRAGFDQVKVEEGRISSFRDSYGLAHSWLWLNLSSLFGSRATNAILHGEQATQQNKVSIRSILRSAVMWLASVILSFPLYLISKIFVLKPTNLWAVAAAKE